jgi:hypothetical protein
MNKMRILIVIAIAAFFAAITPAVSSAALKYDPQADANAAGSWSSTVVVPQHPPQEFGACELYQFFVHTSTPRTGGGYNYTYSRYRDGSGSGCYGLWPGLNPWAADPETAACSTWKESPTVRVFKCGSWVLKAQRVWWDQYGARQKGIRWSNFYTMSWLIGTARWYL